MPYIHIVLNTIPTLYEGYVVSVHRMVMENRPVDPGSIQGSHRPISFIRIKHRTHAIVFFVKLSLNDHVVGLVRKKHIIQTCLMYHAACKVEFQPCKRSYAQLTFFNFYKKNNFHKKLKNVSCEYDYLKKKIVETQLCKLRGTSYTFV